MLLSVHTGMVGSLELPGSIPGFSTFSQIQKTEGRTRLATFTYKKRLIVIHEELAGLLGRMMAPPVRGTTLGVGFALAAQPVSANHHHRR
jgi:hypothetical protein